MVNVGISLRDEDVNGAHKITRLWHRRDILIRLPAIRMDSDVFLVADAGLRFDPNGDACDRPNEGK